MSPEAFRPRPESFQLIVRPLLISSVAIRARALWMSNGATGRIGTVQPAGLERRSRGSM